MYFEKDISSLEQLPLVAHELLDVFKGYTLFLFDSEMGTGKTTFIKELCRQLGSHDALSSPTYSIVNEYHAAKNKLFHFDLYRLKTGSELFEIGFDDYLSTSNYCFIEWPQLALPYLKDEKYVTVKIKLDQSKRILCAIGN